MNKNREEYYFSAFDKKFSKCINALEKQSLNLSGPDLRFLEDDRVEARRKELQMRRERLRERKENQQYKLENAEKIQENEARWLRAIKTIKEEEDKIKELKKDNKKLRDAEMVEDTGRDSDCGGAQSIRKEILEKEEKSEHEQQELIESINKLRTLILHPHNTPQEQQEELEKECSETRKWDTVPPGPSLEIPDLEELELEELEELLSIVERKQLLDAQIRDRIRSINEMIAPYCTPVPLEDISAKLEPIRNHLQLEIKRLRSKL